MAHSLTGLEKIHILSLEEKGKIVLTRVKSKDIGSGESYNLTSPVLGT